MSLSAQRPTPPAPLKPIRGDDSPAYSPTTPPSVFNAGVTPLVSALEVSALEAQAEMHFGGLTPYFGNQSPAYSPESPLGHLLMSPYDDKSPAFPASPAYSPFSPLAGALERHMSTIDPRESKQVKLAHASVIVANQRALTESMALYAIKKAESKKRAQLEEIDRQYIALVDKISSSDVESTNKRRRV